MTKISVSENLLESSAYLNFERVWAKFLIKSPKKFIKPPKGMKEDVKIKNTPININKRIKGENKTVDIKEREEIFPNLKWVRAIVETIAKTEDIKDVDMDKTAFLNNSIFHVHAEV